MLIKIGLHIRVFIEVSVRAFVSVCICTIFQGENLLAMDAVDTLASALACACRGGIKMRTNGIIERRDI